MSGVLNITVSGDDHDIRIDRWFQRHYPDITHVSLAKAIRKGNIRVNKKRVKASQRLQAGDELRIPPIDSFRSVPKEKRQGGPVLTEQKIKRLKEAFIYEDKAIAAINKPYDLAVQGGTGIKESVDDYLKYIGQTESEKPKLVHRLDKETTGILLVAKSAKYAAMMSELFRERKIEKFYIAFCCGIPSVSKGTIEAPLARVEGRSEKMVVDPEEGKPSKTHYTVLQTYKKYNVALVKLQPVTGRTHQLRVHMDAIGHPLVGDKKYGGSEVLHDDFAKKLHLHAAQIIIPEDNPEIKGRTITAPLPAHMQQACEMLNINYDAIAEALTVL